MLKVCWLMPAISFSRLSQPRARRPNASLMRYVRRLGDSPRNLADRSLPRSAIRIARMLASTSPDFLLHERSEYLEDRIRLDRDGLWIDSRLVVGRAALIEHISRGDVREVRFTQPGDEYWRSHLLFGLAAGAMFGYMYGSQCGPGAVRAECDG